MLISFRGMLLVIVILLHSWILFNIVYMWPILLLTTLKRLTNDRAVRPLFSVLNQLSNYIKWIWFMFLTFLFETILGIRFAYTVVDDYGEKHMKSHFLTAYDRGKGIEVHPDLDKIFSPPSKSGKVKIILLNHHSRVDWLYFAIFLIRSRAFWTLRFILKNDLRHIPVMGWCMEVFGFMFLSRSWESDKAYLQNMINYNKTMNEACTLVIFPEGTDLSRSNIERSQAFARVKGMPTFHHVLNPRTTGLIGIKNMIGPENIEEIVDCTIGYTYSAPRRRPNEASLVDGSHSRKVHLLVRSHAFRFPTTKPNIDVGSGTLVPIDDDKFCGWIHDRFAEKEQLLSRFYRNSPIGYDAADVREVYGEHCAVESYDCDEYHANTATSLCSFSLFLREIRRKNSKIWWVRFVNSMFYCFLSIFSLWYVGWYILLLYCAIATIVFIVFLRAVKNLQQALFL
ncbi:unnamed protein product [Phytomonas sp. EM1]|nr:unnamed protein product [Phytomonas sp. EM1]|eukprot:CCW63921.1 unnamed protein product [Phytomonas sp. isolate EM1]